MQNTIKYIANNFEKYREQKLVPLHVRIETSEACNYRCNFCVFHDPERNSEVADTIDMKNRLIELQRCKELIKECQEIGVKCISFTGSGDPLIHPNMDQILKTCNEAELKVGITSNFAMNIKEEVIEELSNAEWIRWSQNAGTDESHKLINRNRSEKDSFERANDNIKRLVRAIKGKKTVLTSSVVVNDLTTPFIEECIKRAINLGIKRISFRPDVPLMAKGMSNYTKEQMEKLDSLYNKYKEEIEIDWNLTRDELKEFRTDELEHLSCQYSSVSTFVSAAFDVYPCCYTRIDKSYSMGNIERKHFGEFWLSEARRENPDKICVRDCPNCMHISSNIEIKNLINPEDRKGELSSEFL